jgi:predicted membrane protein
MIFLLKLGFWAWGLLGIVAHVQLNFLMDKEIQKTWPELRAYWKKTSIASATNVVLYSIIYVIWASMSRWAVGDKLENFLAYGDAWKAVFSPFLCYVAQSLFTKLVNFFQDRVNQALPDKKP